MVAGYLLFLQNIEKNFLVLTAILMKNGDFSCAVLFQINYEERKKVDKDGITIY